MNTVVPFTVSPTRRIESHFVVPSHVLERVSVFRQILDYFYVVRLIFSIVEYLFQPHVIIELFLRVSIVKDAPEKRECERLDSPLRVLPPTLCSRPTRRISSLGPHLCKAALSLCVVLFLTRTARSNIATRGLLVFLQPPSRSHQTLSSIPTFSANIALIVYRFP